MLIFLLLALGGLVLLSSAVAQDDCPPLIWENRDGIAVASLISFLLWVAFSIAGTLELL